LFDTGKKVLIRILKIILIMCIFLCIALTNGANRKASFIENFMMSIIYIPQRGVEYISKLISQDGSFFEDIKTLKTENDSLKEENKYLREQLADYDLIKEENKRLIMNNNSNYYFEDYEVVIADVLEHSTNNWDETLTINKGYKDGIEPNMVVITTNGLVGHVSTCNDHSSKVILILDATSTVSSRVISTREEALIKGNNFLKNENSLIAKEFPIDYEFTSGDEVETSGMGGIYPKGIRIGTITKIENKSNPLENQAIVKASVNFSKLETVAIIISKIEKDESVVE